MIASFSKFLRWWRRQVEENYSSTRGRRDQQKGLGSAYSKPECRTSVALTSEIQSHACVYIFKKAPPGLKEHARQWFCGNVRLEAASLLTPWCLSRFLVPLPDPSNINGLGCLYQLACSTKVSRRGCPRQAIFKNLFCLLKSRLLAESKVRL